MQASASPVLTNIIEKPRKIHGGSSKRVIKILGVPCDAVSVFVRFLYSPRFVNFFLFFYHILVKIIPVKKEMAIQSNILCEIFIKIPRNISYKHKSSYLIKLIDNYIFLFD